MPIRFSANGLQCIPCATAISNCAVCAANGCQACTNSFFLQSGKVGRRVILWCRVSSDSPLIISIANAVPSLQLQSQELHKVRLRGCLPSMRKGQEAQVWEVHLAVVVADSLQGCCKPDYVQNLASAQNREQQPEAGLFRLIEGKHSASKNKTFSATPHSFGFAQFWVLE